jgi:BASS family bile acid:Na+ symporter
VKGLGVTMILLMAVKIAVAALIAAIGMGASLTDVTYLWRRPALLARSLVAMYVLVPLATLLMVLVLPLEGSVKAALLVLAVSAGAPLLPRKLQEFGSRAYGFSLVFTSSLLAVVLTPTWVALLALIFGVSADLSWWDVAKAIGMAFFAPLLIGIALGRLFPSLVGRPADRLAGMAALALAVATVALLVGHWEIMFDVRLSGFVTLVVLMGIALTIGHVLGGPIEGDRTTLAIACSTRHIGVAVVVATTFRGPQTITILAGYIIASALVSFPYLRWRRRIAALQGS